MLTKQLATFAINTRESDVPQAVLDGARDALVDTLGCTLAGTLDEGAEIAQRWVMETGARAQSIVLGTRLSTSPAEAAFANGLAAHALDFDDAMTTLRGHPTAPMLGAGLAVGEAVGASGKAVLAAMSVGLEVGGKLGPAFGAGHYIKGWHSTATVGVFGATAVAANADAAYPDAAYAAAATVRYEYARAVARVHLCLAEYRRDCCAGSSNAGRRVRRRAAHHLVPACRWLCIAGT